MKMGEIKMNQRECRVEKERREPERLRGGWMVEEEREG